MKNNDIISSATSGDVIDIGDLDYEWQFGEASKKLEKYVKSFELYKIGLSDAVWLKVCPEAGVDLFECMSATSTARVNAFYEDCLAYIEEIFPRGSDDLKEVLGKTISIISCYNKVLDFINHTS